ncbi:hypothetical protein INT47_004454 [Mucor saturninus]|uniref:DUF8032 domain-containing protein n=1 Tax=Mucor saturninus TaxID=64648 RepID=A0A8H7QTJ4_9FUNG|nr:hypothetical protein INT47_004454 [Mucor saturninus]
MDALNTPVHRVDIKQETFDGDNNQSLLAWSDYINQTQPLMWGTEGVDMPGLVDPSIWSTEPQQEPNGLINSTFDNLFGPWNDNIPSSAPIKDEWPLNPMQQVGYQQQDPLSFMTMNNAVYVNPYSREITPPSSITSENNSPNSSISSPPSCCSNRRKSSSDYQAPRPYRRRASSHPSVASVVSLTAHEPIARIIGGVEHITFLYSHDRLVKEYTVRTDVNSVNLENIPQDFRTQNAIYPRANVAREEYDGNRWEYETSCNKLGWQLCWLNQDQLCGRRGLIQRAVDSYRNRHTEMRSRRVTRQEKVANGTLRKRRVKKAQSAIL